MLVKELKYYCLLDVLKKYDEVEKWIEVYEKVSSKIKLRERLQGEYKYIKMNGDFS